MKQTLCWHQSYVTGEALTTIDGDKHWLLRLQFCSRSALTQCCFPRTHPCQLLSRYFLLSTAGLARQKAIERRKDSLLFEFKAQNSSKKSKFEDKRIGEGDDSLSNETKMLSRFQAERAQRNKHFNLDNVGSDANFALNHLGSKSKDESLEDSEGGSGSDDERKEEGGEKRGGFKETVRDPNVPDNRTRKEIMEEVMMKSKYYRMEKAKQLGEQHDLLNSLDADFTGIRDALEYKDNAHGDGKSYNLHQST